MSLIYGLLIAHFIADFVLQSDWMALKKSKDLAALGVHVFVYTATIGVLLPVIAIAGRLPIPIGGSEAVSTWVMANGVAHFTQDAITSQVSARLWKAEERHWFFVCVGFDQLLHYITLFVTAGWWLR